MLSLINMIICDSFNCLRLILINPEPLCSSMNVKIFTQFLSDFSVNVERKKKFTKSTKKIEEKKNKKIKSAKQWKRWRRKKMKARKAEGEVKVWAFTEIAFGMVAAEMVFENSSY